MAPEAGARAACSRSPSLRTFARISGEAAILAVEVAPIAPEAWPEGGRT